MSDVVVTGIGVVSPLGVGRDAVWQAVRERRSGVRLLENIADSIYPGPIGGLVADFEPKQYIRPRKSLKVMAPDIQYACAAAELAWLDAQLGEANVNPDRTGVVCGAGMICIDPLELMPAYQTCVKDGHFDYDRWGQEGIKNLYPLWLLKHLPNMPSCHIGIARDARGPNNSISLGDVSSLLAIGEATDVIRRGAADVMISGGTSARTPVVDMVWRAGARVSCRRAEPQRACRPFDAERDGLVNGEGSAQLTLESRAHAEARGARVVARVVGFGRRCEPSARTLAPTGAAIRASIEAALSDAHLRADDIGCVNAHGLSTVEDDPVEAQAIHDILGDVPVTAPKSFMGNLGAGGGAVEAACSLLGVAEQQIPPTLNYETPDASCPVRVVAEMETLDRPNVLCLNYNQLGQSVVVIFSAP